MIGIIITKNRPWNQVTRIDNGIKIIYLPTSPADYNFIRPGQTPAQNNLAATPRLLLYGQGLPLSSPCVR